MRRVTHNLPDRWLIFPIDPGKVGWRPSCTQTNRNAATVFDTYIAAEMAIQAGFALQLLYDRGVPITWTDWGLLRQKRD
jgi:hypothetical protein